MTAAYQRPDLSIDQALALRTAAVRLNDRLREVVGVETLERALHCSYDEFPGRAALPDHLPLLADVVITMGCGDACPVFPGRRYEEWVLDDPEGMDVDAVRPVRDEIERRVRRLLGELGVAAP